MKFYVDINVKGLPTCVWGQNDDFKKLPLENGDLLVTTGEGGVNTICFRDGRRFQDVRERRGKHDTCTLVFDDFHPDITPDDDPDWYDELCDRILCVRAQESYGSAHGIQVRENYKYGCATAKIRHQQSDWGKNGELVYFVKISAKGEDSLRDARDRKSVV